MVAGFEVYNSYGTASITDSSTLFSLVSKGSFSYNESNTRLEISATRTLLNPILAIVPKSAPVTYTQALPTSSSTVAFIISSSTAQEFEWFLFDAAPPNANTVKAGLEVYKQNGVLVYASQTPVMKVVDFANNHFTYTKTVPSGKKYAVALANTYTYKITEVYASLESSDPEYDWYRQNTRTVTETAAYMQISNTIDMTEITASTLIQGNLYRVVSDDPPPFPETYKEEFLGQTTALIVDVTNY